MPQNRGAPRRRAGTLKPDLEAAVDYFIGAALVFKYEDAAALVQLRHCRVRDGVRDGGHRRSPTIHHRARDEGLHVVVILASILCNRCDVEGAVGAKLV